jgi:hypothetical protein
MARLIDALEQILDDAGKPVADGLIDFFESGSTSVRKATYADIAETIPNDNPLTINGDGRVPNVFGTGSYSIIVRDSSGQIIQRDPIGGEESTNFGADWAPDVIYDLNSVVRDANEYWFSKISGNVGNKPSTDSGVNWGFLSAASNVFYDGSTSGLSATDVQGAIDEIDQIVEDNATEAATNTSLNTGYDKKQWPTLSNAADIDHDITFSAGKVRDSSFNKLIYITSDLTKQIDASWVAGNDVGGLFSGTVAADTTYHCFVIFNDSTQAVDAGFSTDVNASDIPTGYTNYRRIGSIITDASANIEPFFQREDYFGLVNRRRSLTTGTPGTSEIIVDLSVPSGIEVMSDYLLHFSVSSIAYCLTGSLEEPDVLPDSTNFHLVCSPSASVSQVKIQKKTNTSGQIRVRSSIGTVGGLVVFTEGYYDDRAQ